MKCLIYLGHSPAGRGSKALLLPKLQGTGLRHRCMCLQKQRIYVIFLTPLHRTSSCVNYTVVWLTYQFPGSTLLTYTLVKGVCRITLTQ